MKQLNNFDLSSDKNSYGYTPAEQRKFNTRGLVYLIMFSLLYCCIYCMRQNFTYGGQYIMEGLKLTKGEIGILTSTLFWTYGIGHLVNGRLSEKVGPPKFIILAVVLSFLCNMCMGLTESLVAMAIIWGFNGYFQSMAWTSGLSVLTNWYPSERRGFAVGFAHAFSGFGAAISSLMIVAAVTLSDKLSLGLGWRAVFLLPGLLPITVLVFYFFFAKTSPEKVGLRPYVEKDAEKNEAEDEMKALVKEKGVLYPYLHLIRNPRFLVFVFVAFFTGVARYGMTQWVPYYFSEIYSVSVESSLLGSLALPVGMAVGTFIVPVLTDKFCPKNRMPAVILSAALAAVSIVGFLFLNPTDPVQLVLIQILLFLAGFGIYAVDGIAFTYACDIGGRVFSATASGILDFAVYMGAAVQSIVYGFVFDLNPLMVFVTMIAFLAINALLAVPFSLRKKAA